MQDNALFTSMGLEHTSLLRRLLNSCAEAVSELRENPQAFIVGAIRGDGIGGRRRQMFLQYGLAISILAYSAGFLLTLALWTYTSKTPISGNEKIRTPIFFPTVGPAPSPEATLRKDDKDQDPQGGGGGGDHSALPTSFGQRPDFSIMAPTTRSTLTPPEIAIKETLLGDPNLNLKRDDLMPTGLPNGDVGPPSDGQGKNNGIGTGDKGGMGPGDGPGFGPGRNGGQGGDDYSNGTRRDPNRDRPDTADAVDTKPVALNRPRPNYTEPARQNKIQGLVRTRVLVGADGAVKQVQIRGGGLPNGLNEEAIRAAYQMRFKPAMKNGQPVAFWITVDIEFNIR
jgi:TonB family protein